jgi:hypothetical protein
MRSEFLGETFSKFPPSAYSPLLVNIFLSFLLLQTFQSSARYLTIFPSTRRFSSNIYIKFWLVAIAVAGRFLIHL